MSEKYLCIRILAQGPGVARGKITKIKNKIAIFLPITSPGHL